MELYEVKHRDIWRRIKAALTSRSDTLKQSDAVTDMLMDKLAQSAADIKKLEDIIQKMAAVLQEQHAALVDISGFRSICESRIPVNMVIGFRLASNRVQEAIDSAKQPL